MINPEHMMENNIVMKYTIDEITGAWYEAYGEYMKDEYAGFFEIIEKPKKEKEKKDYKKLSTYNL